LEKARNQLAIVMRHIALCPRTFLPIFIIFGHGGQWQLIDHFGGDNSRPMALFASGTGKWAGKMSLMI